MQLYNDDCLNILPNIKDNSIDMICCDLPYYKVVKNNFDNQWKDEKEYLFWVEDNIKHFNRISKKDSSIMLFTSRQYSRHICFLLDKYGFIEKRIIIWARKRGFNNTRGKALSSGYEPISYYTKGNPTFNNIKIKPKTNRKEYTDGILKDGISLSDVWSDISALPHNSKEKTGHPTQKPIALMERCISICTNENDVVLDFTMGSGSTGVACKNLNRDFIGIEIDKEYFNIAKERLENCQN